MTTAAVYLIKMILMQNKELPLLPVLDDAGDEYINRPLASVMVGWLINTPVTPNQVTLASVVLGLISIWFMTYNTYALTVFGAVLLQFSIVVDCVDGQLARAKNMTSEWGDIFDHTTDDAKIALITIAIAWNLVGAAGMLFTACLIFAALAMVLLATCGQYFYCMEYAAVRKGRTPRELLRHISGIREMSGKRPWTLKYAVPKLILAYYLFRLGIVWLMIRATNPSRLRNGGSRWGAPVRPSRYYETQIAPLNIWRFMGMGGFAIILLIFALADKMLYLPLAYICAAPFYLLAWRRQLKADRDFLACNSAVEV
ncbi:MAG: CDP-alcohol phosphatidyltransferase family protein [bacterium]